MTARQLTVGSKVGGPITPPTGIAFAGMPSRSIPRSVEVSALAGLGAIGQIRARALQRTRRTDLFGWRNA